DAIEDQRGTRVCPVGGTPKGVQERVARAIRSSGKDGATVAVCRATAVRGPVEVAGAVPDQSGRVCPVGSAAGKAVQEREARAVGPHPRSTRPPAGSRRRRRSEKVCKIV